MNVHVCTVPLPGNIPLGPGFVSRDLGIGTGLGTANNSVPMDVWGLKSGVLIYAQMLTVCTLLN